MNGRREFIAGVGATLLSGVVRADGSPILKVGLLSDTHVNDELASCGRTRLAMATFRREGVDVVAHLGDLANYHMPQAYRNYRAVIDETFPAHLPRPRFLYAWGNHDSIDYARRDNPKDRQIDRRAAFSVMKEALGIDHGLDFEMEIGGYAFLGVPEFITDVYSLKEFERRISEACARHPGKPVFVLHHPPPRGTCDNSLKGCPATTGPIYERHPQVVVISGHKHTTVMNERSIWQGGYTVVQTSCLYNWCANWEAAAEGAKAQVRSGWGVMVMYVYRDRLEFRRFDVRSPEERGRDRRWVVPVPFVAESAPYAPQRRRAVEPEGVFPVGASVRATADRQGKWLTVQFPTVENVEDVRLYKVVAKRKVADGWELADHVDVVGDFDEMPHGRKGFLTGRMDCRNFSQGDAYRISVTPEGFFGKGGKPILGEWRSAQ